jgi:hypothetical protein
VLYNWQKLVGLSLPQDAKNGFPYNYKLYDCADNPTKESAGTDK